MQSLVTFDFHNTLATCDPWFELEIRDLPAEALARIDPAFVPDRDDVTARYRRLREEVMRSGREVDAVEGVDRIARQLGLAIDEATIAASVRDLMREATRHAAPVPGAIEAVRQIAAQGIPVGVISSAVYHPFLEWTLEAFGLGDDLAFVVTSASSGHYKSNPEIYRYAMRLVDADPASSVHIGDSPKWDVWGAQQAGMSAVWFSNGFTGTFVDREHESEPDAVVTTMNDVAPWVLRHLGKNDR
ncbi:MAG TPA: HAD family hydrolase [Thermomicrobiales bacterium]|nr:HAD family hydrolase [Thermomicrobiales bacterium]